MIGNKHHLDNVILLKTRRAMHYRLEVKGYGIKVPELELGKSKIHIRWRPNTSGKLYDLLSREAAYNTIFIYQSIWPNLIRVLHICVHIPTHPKLWDKTIWGTKVGVKEHQMVLKINTIGEKAKQHLRCCQQQVATTHDQLHWSIHPTTPNVI